MFLAQSTVFNLALQKVNANLNSLHKTIKKISKKIAKGRKG